MADSLEVGIEGEARSPRVLVRRAGLVALGVAATTIALAAGTAGASKRAALPTAPLAIQTSSLTQTGQLLQWQLVLQQSFSPSGLEPEGRSLCLLIESTHSGDVVGKACIEGPARGSREPRIVYTPITTGGPGRATTIAATIGRSSSQELTASFLPGAVGLGYAPLRWQAISTLRRSACATPAPGSSGCFALFPATPTLLDLHVPKLVGCVPAGPSLVYQGSSHVREIALTFDDGPWYEPPPPAFLDVLEREHVPATFFEIGRQISTYDPTGAYERRMLADGDMIGDHSWSHPDVAQLPVSQQRQQLLHAAAAIRRATRGFTPCLWRPPYGDIGPSLIRLARSLGFLTIMWNVDPRDWAQPGVSAIYDNVVTHARDGAIVLQHFGGGPRYQTVAALPREIDTLRREGYRFVTVAQMLGLQLVYR